MRDVMLLLFRCCIFRLDNRSASLRRLLPRLERTVCARLPRHDNHGAGLLSGAKEAADMRGGRDMRAFGPVPQRFARGAEGEGGVSRARGFLPSLLASESQVFNGRFRAHKAPKPGEEPHKPSWWHAMLPSPKRRSWEVWYQAM